MIALSGFHNNHIEPWLFAHFDRVYGHLDGELMPQ